jgi:hypothetical protein
MKSANSNFRRGFCYTLCFVYMAIGFACCIPDPLEVKDVPAVEPEIVVSSQIISDTLVVVGLTKTIGALDASSDSDPYQLREVVAIKDATVTLTVNNKTYTLPHLQDGAYQGHFIPLSVGDKCDLKVVSPSMGEVSASTIVQEPVFFDTVRAEVFVEKDYMSYAKVTYALNDPPTPNYYMLNVNNAKRDVMMQNAMNPAAYIKLVEDNNFNGNFFSEIISSAPQRFTSGDSVAVSLTNISPDYYEFLKLRISNRLGLVEYLSEPINYPTNVVGGRGYFNLHMPDVKIMVLP